MTEKQRNDAGLDEPKPVEPAALPDAAARGGLGSQLLDRAKKAKEQAQVSVASLATKSGELRDQAATLAEELKEGGVNRLLEVVDDLNASLPIIREAGYALKGISISLGIPPKATASFAAAENVSAEAIDEILRVHADKKFAALLIRALFQAWQMQAKIKIGALKPTGLSVDIGLVPSVSVSFS